jgi:hypothetical protein
MTYSLVRERDQAGDCGPMSLGLIPVYEDDKIIELKYEQNCVPRVGIAMQVGSPYARSYQNQDYWQTTLIREILEERENYVKFKTGNSTYEWKIF